MTTYQKTLEVYKSGSKAMAYLAFKADVSSNEGVTFEQFCKAFDKIIENRKK